MAGIENDCDRLIGAARALLMEDGYGSVTAETACARAEVDRSGFDRYFTSRDDLVLAALNAHWADLKVHLDQAFEPGIAPLEKLRRFFDGIVGFQDMQASQFGCVVGCLLIRVGSAAGRLDDQLRPRVSEMLAELQGYIERALREAQAQGQIRRGDIRTMAWTLIHYTEGVLGMARIQNDLAMLQGMLDRSLEFLGAPPRAYAQ